MLYKTLSAAVYGIDANIIEVEAQVSGVKMSEDHFHTVGLSSEPQKLYCNAQMPPQFIRKFCELSADCERFWNAPWHNRDSAPAPQDRLLKVARTIADVEDTPQLEPKHIAEAIQSRTLDRTFWAGAIVFGDTGRMSANLLDSCQLARHNPETRQSIIANWVTADVLHATNL
jgi:Magnesium chelatase, subunit ChlI C-terminal